VSGAGKCESKIKVSKLETKVHVGAAGGKPAITPSGNVDVEIGDTDMGCDGLSGAAVNLVNDLFQDKIITALQAQAQQAIVLGIQAVGKALGGFSLDVPITDGFGTLRFDLTGQPNVTSDAAAMPLIADLVKANTTSSGTPYPPPRQLPPYDKSVGGYFQTYLSDYSFNSTLHLLEEWETFTYCGPNQGTSSAEKDIDNFSTSNCCARNSNEVSQYAGAAGSGPSS